MPTAETVVTSEDFSVLAEASGVAVVYSFAPEGHYLAKVESGVATLLVAVVRLDEELEARVAAEEALAARMEY